MITDIEIKNLPSKDSKYLVTIEPGFKIRVSPSGTKTFLFVYEHSGKRAEINLGKYPQVRLAEARGVFKRYQADVIRGIDPAADIKKTKLSYEKERSELTIKQLAVEYIEKHSKVKKKSWREDERILNKDVVPVWGERYAKDIIRREVVQLLDKIALRGGVQANRTLAVIRKMFAFGIERGLLDDTPCSHIKQSVKEMARERVLSDDEIRLFWATVEQSESTAATIKAALKMLLITGLRRSEVVGIRWNDIVGDWLTVADTKNGTTHRLPLSTIALEILATLPKGNDEPHSDYVFPGKAGHVHVDSINTALHRMGLDDVTPHDLRRTLGTSLGQLGFNRLIQDKILNHIDNSVGGIYDRHSYDKEKVQAMEAWSRRLTVILKGELGQDSNVVKFG